MTLTRIEAEWRERERGNVATFVHNFDDIISVQNLLTAWREFVRGKSKRKDVELFSIHLMDNILSLHNELKSKCYIHSTYKAFKINDPKPRDIHKASVRDRLLHHAIYRILYPFFDSKFIFDSYSCRRGKGTHRAINRFRSYARQVSINHTRTSWVLKCDVRKFFANIDHEILLNILSRYIKDKNTAWLLSEIIRSFHTENRSDVGLPLGNLTSQLLVNIYMNDFDQFIKRELKVKYYIRYADDFVILCENKRYLENILPKIAHFLGERLKLSLHPDKVFIKTVASGVDFLGWVHFPYHRIQRTSTKNRMLRNLSKTSNQESIASYLGLLSHGDSHKLKTEILRKYFKQN